MMKRMMVKSVAMLVMAVAGFLTDRAEALQLSPVDFSSLGTLNSTSDIVMNTDTLQLTGGVSFTGVRDAGSQAAVFTFDTIQASNMSIIGSNPLALLSKGGTVLNGTVNLLNGGGLEIASGGTVSLANGASILSNGSNLTILSQDIVMVGTSSVRSSGAITLGTTQGLVPGPLIPQGNAGTGSLTITSGSGSNLFHTLNAFNVGSGQVQLSDLEEGSSQV